VYIWDESTFTYHHPTFSHFFFAPTPVEVHWPFSFRGARQEPGAAARHSKLPTSDRTIQHIWDSEFSFTGVAIRGPYDRDGTAQQHTATHGNTRQHGNTLQHTTTHCNTLKHIATHRNNLLGFRIIALRNFFFLKNLMRCCDLRVYVF